MTDRNHELFEEVIEMKLAEAATGNEESFKQAMQAIDKQQQFYKTDADYQIALERLELDKKKHDDELKESKKGRIWTIAGSALTIVGGLVTGLVMNHYKTKSNLEYADKVLHYEETDILTTTPARQLSSLVRVDK